MCFEDVDFVQMIVALVLEMGFELVFDIDSKFHVPLFKISGIFLLATI